MKTQLENRTVLLARPEVTYGVDSIAPNLASSPSPYVTDALLCSEVDVRNVTEQLARANYSPSLSKDTVGAGRMLLQLTFRTELKASGSLGVAPRIGRLIKGSGFQETIVAATAAAVIGDAVAGPANSSTPAGVIKSGLTGGTNKTTAPTQMYDTYRVTVTTGGAPATAKFIVTGVGFPENDALVLNSLQHTYITNSAAGVIAVTGTAIAPIFTFTGTWVADEFIEIYVGGIRFFYQVATGDTSTVIADAFEAKLLADGRFTGTSAAVGALTVALAAGAAASPGAGDFLSSATAQAVTLGQSGAVITIPAWTGALVAGEYFDIPLTRPGVRYDPVSDNFTSLTFYVYLDGTLIKLTGARGTFSVEGAATQYPTCSWTFTGIFNDPIDKPLPSGLAFEESLPYKVELAELAVYGMVNACASRFTFDIANTVEPKPCINASEAYDEIWITDRAPVAGADPEAGLPSEFNPWHRMRRNNKTRFHVAVGKRGGTGNIVRIVANNVNFRDAPYSSRNKIRAFDYQLHLARQTASGNDEVSFQFS